MTYQKLIIVGYLGGDPDLRFTDKGVPVASFSLATSRTWRSGDGTQNKETTWFRITCWNRTAEIAKDWLTKGRQVMIEGRMRPDPNSGGPRIWTGNDGNPRASYEVTADRLVLLSRNNDAPAGRGSGGGGAGGAQASDDAGPDYGAEEDIPF